MTTGDLKNNLRKLQNELKLARYREEIALEALSKGEASALLPIYHYVFVNFSPHIAKEISNADMELNGKTDLRFIEGMYKVLRELYNYHPPVTKVQFFSAGYAERKVIMAYEIINMVRQRHKKLQPARKGNVQLSSSLSNIHTEKSPRAGSFTTGVFSKVSDENLNPTRMSLGPNWRPPALKKSKPKKNTEPQTQAVNELRQHKPYQQTTTKPPVPAARNKADSQRKCEDIISQQRLNLDSGQQPVSKSEICTEVHRHADAGHQKTTTAISSGDMHPPRPRQNASSTDTTHTVKAAQHGEVLRPRGVTSSGIVEVSSAGAWASHPDVIHVQGPPLIAGDINTNADIPVRRDEGYHTGASSPVMEAGKAHKCDCTERVNMLESRVKSLEEQNQTILARLTILESRQVSLQAQVEPVSNGSRVQTKPISSVKKNDAKSDTSAPFTADAEAAVWSIPKTTSLIQGELCASPVLPAKSYDVQNYTDENEIVKPPSPIPKEGSHSAANGRLDDDGIRSSTPTESRQISELSEFRCMSEEAQKTAKNIETLFEGTEKLLQMKPPYLPNSCTPEHKDDSSSVDKPKNSPEAKRVSDQIVCSGVVSSDLVELETS